MKLIDHYLEIQREIREKIANRTCSAKELFCLQEINYRILVFETLRDFSYTAPLTSDMRELSEHYKLFDAYVGFLLTERQFGCKADAERVQKRETARAALARVVQDYRRRFSNLHVTSPDQYQREIQDTIHVILATWVQYRSTYINFE